jgi:type IV pilus assembly protein PilY1
VPLKAVAFFAGGYDQCNDPNGNCGSSDQKGNAVYAIDITDGSRLWSFSKPDNSAMTKSMPSDVAALDINGDDSSERVYVGDLGGQLWRFDTVNLNNTAAWTSSGKIIFKSNQSSSEKRKIFYPPEVSLESGYEWVYFGTGDRENPKQETGTGTFPTQNRLYAIKDKNPSVALTETSLVDVTDDILQKPNPTSGEITTQTQTRNDLKNKYGWFITLTNNGEKCLASALIYAGVVYYTTFTPDFAAVGDICSLKEGTGRVYALQYTSGMAAFNLDLFNDTEGQPATIYRTDRSMTIGGGIPSQVVVAIVKGDVVGYIGVGGGVYSPQMGSKRIIIPLYWRTVF